MLFNWESLKSLELMLLNEHQVIAMNLMKIIDTSLIFFLVPK